ISSEERKEYQEKINALLENVDARNKLSFLGSISSEERKEYQEKINALLESKNIDTSDKLSFLGRISLEEKFFCLETKKLSKTINSQLIHKIGDKGLREQYYRILQNYLIEKQSSLMKLKLYAKKDKLALFLGLNSLGLNSLPALSWKLSKEEKLSLEYSLINLSKNESNKNLLENIYLPFDSREKGITNFGKYLVEWFASLNFLNSLRDVLGISKDLLSNHLALIKEQQK
ncbi:MAG: hypothetical protein AAB732_02515, partial [Patescibacteria group bacterium]